MDCAQAETRMRIGMPFNARCTRVLAARVPIPSGPSLYNVGPRRLLNPSAGQPSNPCDLKGRRSVYSPVSRLALPFGGLGPRTPVRSSQRCIPDGGDVWYSLRCGKAAA